MSALLIHPDGTYRVWSPLDEDEETILKEADSVGPYLKVSLTADDYPMTIWMGVDAAQVTNQRARHIVAMLTSLHFLCFGPVLIDGLDDDMITEVTGG